VLPDKILKTLFWHQRIAFFCLMICRTLSFARIYCVFTVDSDISSMAAISLWEYSSKI